MRLLEKVVAWVAPHQCLVCGAEGPLLCDWCLPDACPALPDRCYLCLRVSPSCRTCEFCRSKSRLKHVWVATAYETAAKKLVYKLKFVRAQDAAGIMADYLDARLPYFAPDVIVTSLPAATRRARVRGYDQAVLIAQSFARKRGLLSARLLSRKGQQRQVGAGRKQRLAQLEAAFRPLNNHLIKDATVLLIDDVLTTGASIETAAKILRLGGARTVNGAVFAQTAPGVH